MLEVGLLIAGMCGIAVWFVGRHSSVLSTMRPKPARPSRTGRPGDRASRAADPRTEWSPDPARLCAANGALAERLWKLGYGLRSEGRPTERMDGLIRDNVAAILQVDSLNQKYFPRRPALMPQLMQAVDDPRTASDKLARVVAHDPVLTADVLRLANSSLYRTSPAPIETIQRAIVLCGVDALRSMLAAAMLRPLFRATSKNLPRLPRVLWDRTERAARAAELYAAAMSPQDRFESQLVVLLNALGPLVVYGATVDVYGRNPIFPPSTALCVSLTRDLAPPMAQRIARDWEVSSRLAAAVKKSSEEPLTNALQVGELLGTLSFLESQKVISGPERAEIIDAAGLPADWVNPLWTTLAKSA